MNHDITHRHEYVMDELYRLSMVIDQLKEEINEEINEINQI